MDTDNSLEITEREEAGRWMRVEEVKYIVTEDLTLGGKHSMQYTDFVVSNCALEICNFINQCDPNKFFFKSKITSDFQRSCENCVISNYHSLRSSNIHIYFFYSPPIPTLSLMLIVSSSHSPSPLLSSSPPTSPYFPSPPSFSPCFKF